MLLLFSVSFTFQYLSFGLTSARDFCSNDQRSLDKHYLSYAINYININSKSLFCVPHLKQFHFSTFENVAENVYEFLEDFNLNVNPNIIIPLDINGYMNMNNIILFVEYRKPKQEVLLSLIYHIPKEQFTLDNQIRFNQFKKELIDYFHGLLDSNVQILMVDKDPGFKLGYSEMVIYLNSLYDTFKKKRESGNICTRVSRLFSFKSREDLGECSPFVDITMSFANFKTFCGSLMHAYGQILFEVFDSVQDLVNLASTRPNDQKADLLDKISIGLVQINDASFLNKAQLKLFQLKKKFVTSANVIDFAKSDAAVFVETWFNNLDFLNNPENNILNNFSKIIN